MAYRFLSYAAILLAVLGYFFYPTLSSKLSAPSHEDFAKETLINYIAQPKFSGDGFFERINGVPVKAEKYRIDEAMLYFSVATQDYSKALLERLATDVKKVEFGTTPAGHYAIDPAERQAVRLGDYTYHVPDRYFFRLPFAAWRIDPTQALQFDYASAVYDITPEELRAYATNQVINGGPLNVIWDSPDGAKRFVNHAVMIAKPGEQSLLRLVNQLVEPDDSTEDKVQKLLDFVTKEIAYDSEEVYNNSETLRRPNESIMSGRADCANKTILFASLLEQIDVDYVLVYTGVIDTLDHMYLAVAGDFTSYNGYDIPAAYGTYHVAETTLPGFQIGETRLQQNPLQASTILLQRSGRDKPIIDARSGQTLRFN